MSIRNLPAGSTSRLSKFLSVALSLPLLFSASAGAQSLDVPDNALTGAPLDILWSGSFEESDYVTVVKPEAADGEWNEYGYLRDGNPITLTLPMEPGIYEVRWNREAEGTVIVRQTLKLKRPEVSLEAPSSADLGTPIEVRWSGPNFPDDYITIVAAGAESTAYEEYVYTGTGNPVTLTAPEREGAYEIRYSHGKSYQMMGSRPLTVGGADISLEVPAEVPAGTTFEVIFRGPKNPGDYITLVPVGAGETEWGDSVEVAEAGDRVSLIAPGEPGTYEVRYAAGKTYRALASTPFEVGDVSATISAPAQGEAGGEIAIQWTGPGGEKDYIELRPVDAPDDFSGWYVYVKEGNPAPFKLPLVGGEYTLGYYLGKGDRRLAETNFRVVAREEPGTLQVVADGSLTAAGEGPAVMVILDASGSMLQRAGSQRRIEVARQALSSLVKSLPEGTPFALRAFGHKEAGSCRTDLEIPLGPLNRSAASGTVGGIQAFNLAKTPIGRSLELVQQDLGGHKGETLVVLLTDGEETCGGDPAAAIRGLRSVGFDVRVNIVGFAIDDRGLKETFQQWARLGEGRYFDASRAAALPEKLLAAVRAPFEVLDASGGVVARGEVGGEAVAVPTGEFTVRVQGGPGAGEHDVVVGSGEAEVLRLE